MPLWTLHWWSAHALLTMVRPTVLRPRNGVSWIASINPKVHNVKKWCHDLWSVRGRGSGLRGTGSPFELSPAQTVRFGVVFQAVERPKHHERLTAAHDQHHSDPVPH